MISVKHPKISILGASDIGCTLAHMICEKNLGDVVLHDFRKGKQIHISIIIVNNFHPFVNLFHDYKYFVNK